MIAIVDYGGGNLRSVFRAVCAANARQTQPDEVLLVSDPEQLRRADRVIFPGQGAMPDCMASLERSGLAAALREAMRERPFFGICVGQQMLFDRSEEGDTPGLGIFPGQVIRFSAARGAVSPDGRALKVPTWGGIRWPSADRTRCSVACQTRRRRNGFTLSTAFMRHRPEKTTSSGSLSTGDALPARWPETT